MNLGKKVAHAPLNPGVYLMKSAEGKIIYVGKAKNLRHRLKSYFQKTSDQSPKVKVLVSRIADLEWMITHTELEALMLECTLIKKHRPRYNVHLRDDKTYPYLRISVQEKWPQLSIVRRPKRDEALYFGPYMSAYSIRETLKLLTQIFPIRDCSSSKFSNRIRPCISYDMGICTAPCVQYISEEAYRKIVEGLVLFLRGKNKKILKELKAKMFELSHQEKYEEAAQLRNRIQGICHLLEKQKVVSLKQGDEDVVGLDRKGQHVEVALLFVRAGRLLGQKTFSFASVQEEDQDFLASFLYQYYDEQFIPDEIILPLSLSSEEHLLKIYLEEKKQKPVNLVTPKSGEKKALVALANENAKEATVGRNLEQKSVAVLEELQKRLHLKNDPHRIECFDISNIQGENAVGSRVTFIEGESDKNLYRRYKIKTIKGPNDYAMMMEVLSRRIKGRQEDALPDLLMVDGGRGQLSIALQVLKELEVEGVDVIALAKEKTISSFQGKMIERLQERVYVPGQKNPIIFPESSYVLHLLQRVRDEAHRFAIAYHKKLRAKKFLEKA